MSTFVTDWLQEELGPQERKQGAWREGGQTDRQTDRRGPCARVGGRPVPQGVGGVLGGRNAFQKSGSWYRFTPTRMATKENPQKIGSAVEDVKKLDPWRIAGEDAHWGRPVETGG